MSRPLATAIAIYAIGCVIPTPLEQDPGQGGSTPTIIQGSPTFMAPIVGTTGTQLTFEVTVTDTNLQDTLTGRIYTTNSKGQYFEAFPDFPLQNIDRTTSKWRGNSTSSDLCGLIGPVQDKQIYVYVTNTAFPMGFDPAKATDPTQYPALQGHYTWAYWILNCQ